MTAYRFVAYLLLGMLCGVVFLSSLNPFHLSFALGMLCGVILVLSVNLICLYRTEERQAT